MQSSRTSLPCPLLQNRACRRVGDQRVTFAGTFPIAPLRTTHDRFRITSLSSNLNAKGQSRFTSDVQYRFGCSHLAYLTTSVSSDYLCHFAL